jgi:hypothetical protein
LQIDCVFSKALFYATAKTFPLILVAPNSSNMINVFVANYANRPSGLDPNSAQFITPSYTYLTPVDERNASAAVLWVPDCGISNIKNKERSRRDPEDQAPSV